MDLARTFSEWGLKALLALGLAVMLQVEFTPPVLEIKTENSHTEYVLSSTVQDAMSPELFALVERSVPVALVFTATLFYQSGGKTVKTWQNRILYKSIDRCLHLSSRGGDVVFAVSQETEVQDALRRWSRLELALGDDISTLRYVILEARLEVPGIQSEQMLKRLWNGARPSISWEAAQ